MGLPQVAIVGRPNVGKSSIFNWLAGRRLAIVDDMAGVTRDRMVSEIDGFDIPFELIDTGGYGIVDKDDLTADIVAQIDVALHEADVILFVVDARAGVAPLDEEVAQRLRGVNKPVICLANKADTPKLQNHAHEFAALGWGNPLPVSAHQNLGRAELEETLVPHLEACTAGETEDAAAEPEMKIAIVGRRNTGKSTFVNSLVQAERMITSEVPGTTRDSVDIRFELDGKPFLAIDTPGFRRQKSFADDVEYYGLHRAQRSIRRADVCLIFFDAAEEISKVDKQIVDYVETQFKPCLFVVNKWDLLADKARTGEWAEYLHDTFRSMLHVPIAFITGKTGRNIKTLLNHAQMLFRQSRQRLPTAEVNRLIQMALDQNPPPLHYHRRAKVYYAVQSSIQPPTIVLFCNMPDAFTKPYQRYLVNYLRDWTPYPEVPIRLLIRKRESSSQETRVNTR